ncbi:type II toxin-antitoxin system HipA family toxin [Paraburkholderia lacunae]|uniref:Type II toxin-antitoxin system HipA family toxin n=1 Tax=Paraburkholderia lacunae TaxID=2211104 RepID=A0A370N400_9BURK|nr:type II toxin-antitoxin system HipA family toxin [Paraburkholderia lacunae]RDK00346.1 type II toxin-antitoxin system HipA family toxin [Paraburkholderia lacunae]
MYVFNNSKPIGILDRSALEANCYVFNYLPEATPADKVSLMMPVGPDQFKIYSHLHPIFQSNIPEGYLLDRVMRMLRGTAAYPDEFSVLQVVGHSQIGRLRYAETSTRVEAAPNLQLSSLLAKPGTEGLLENIFEEYATYSGVAGVQPKVLVRAVDETRPNHLAVRGTTHIVKSFDPAVFPGLAANEFFCMRAAEIAGLPVPRVSLSDDGALLIVERFDLAPEGHYRGFEDFCSLYVMPTSDKYESTYERIARRIKEMVSPQNKAEALSQFFTSVALSCALRNGDAHLKNFGVLYDDPLEDVRLAPAFDIVCTQAYIPNDPMALTLNGTSRYPKHSELMKFGRLACDLSAARVRHALDAVAHGVQQATPELHDYAAAHPEFAEVTHAMTVAWESGLNLTCRADDRPLFLLSDR